MKRQLHIRPPSIALAHHLLFLARRNSFAVLQRVHQQHRNFASNIPSVSLIVLFACALLCAFPENASYGSWPVTILPRTSLYRSLISLFTPQLIPAKMPTHSLTPYVTPHILHKHYAQAHDHENISNRTSPLPLYQSPAVISCSHRSRPGVLLPSWLRHGEDHSQA